MKIDLTKFKELLSIQKERQLVMEDLSKQLGIDISFSDTEVLKFAKESYMSHIEKEIAKGIEEWMKLV
tara:strand:- start:19629 stop:19832 length:204 start_codon:yes stop_codon:yes gene_type:complete